MATIGGRLYVVIDRGHTPIAMRPWNPDAQDYDRDLIAIAIATHGGGQLDLVMSLRQAEELHRQLGARLPAFRREAEREKRRKARTDA